MLPTFPPIVALVVGLVVLVAGGELLVRGASSLAAAARISPLVIGLTVVAFGTSSPELAVTMRSAFAGQTDLAVGNVVGSNICNVLLILGLSAMIAPLVVSAQLVRLDVPLMIGASVLMLLLGLDGTVGRLDGLLMFGALVAYVVWSIRQSRKERKAIVDEFAAHLPRPDGGSLGQIALQLLLVATGLVLLTVGANWLIDGAVGIARKFGLSELMIGLTILAVGTSLPEVAASVIAAIRGERDIAVGNVVGSNLFNILGVLGLSALVAPNAIAVAPAALQFDIPVMIAVAIACLPVFFTGHLIARWEGAMFFAYYVAYVAYLVLAATRATVTREFEIVMGVFVLPLTVVTLIVGVVRAFRAGRGALGDEER
jgi:cation:H+ antiporter